jgi:hypothetical protein
LRCSLYFHISCFLFSFFFLEIRELIKFFFFQLHASKDFFSHRYRVYFFLLLLLLIFLTGSVRIIFILKKIQNGVVLVKNKNKSQRVVIRFLTGILPDQPAGSHRVMIFLIFSSTWLDSNPGSTREVRTNFKTILFKISQQYPQYFSGCVIFICINFLFF